MANETTTYTLYPEVSTDERGRYFDGQFLTAQDFVDEQRYHVDRLRRALDHLTVAGVAEGLEVVGAGPWRVTVRRGAAIDPSGRLLVLATALENVDVPKDIPGGVVEVALRYNEVESRVQGGTSDEDGTRGASRLRELPALDFYAPGAPPRPGVPLAQIKVTESGAVSLVDPDPVRRHSGLRLPSSGAAGPTLRSGAPARPDLVGLTGDLRVSGRLGVGTDDPEAELDIRGVARVGHLSVREHAFTLGGDETSFYPIVFRDLDWSAGAAVLEIVRVSAQADNAGALIARIRWHAGDGQGAELLEAEVIQSRRFIANIKILKKDRLLAVWLRGGRTYTWRSPSRIEIADDKLTSKNLGGEQLDFRATIEAVLDRDRVRLGVTFDREEFRGSLTVTGDLAYTAYLNKLDVAENAEAVVRAYDFKIGHSTRRGSPGRALVDHAGALNVNFAGDWPITRLHGNTEATGSLTVTGDTFLKKSVVITNNLDIDGEANFKKSLAITGNLGVGGDLSITGLAVLKKGVTISGALTLGGELQIDGAIVSKAGARLGDNLVISRNQEHVTLSRPKSSEGGARLFLELVQLDGTTPETYAAIRFHHNNRYWHRLEARSNGLHVRDGDLGRDNYKNFYAGEIRASGDLYANGLHVTTGRAERLRIIRGTVTLSGGIAEGSGFTVSRGDGWLTKITFNTAFSSTPTVVATQQYPDNNTSSEGGRTLDNAVIVRVEASAVWVKCGDSDGDGAWRRFHFIAVGP
ncbi:MAG TPA: hypothetical protein VGB85_25635 [Nannocystis sp.]